MYVLLIALPGLLLISACASALSRDPSESQSKLVLLLVPVLVIALVAGPMTWLQWSSQRGIELGYPLPQVHITPLSSGMALINENVQFSADATGRDITFDWDFGDGSNDSNGSSHETHYYGSTGSYNVTLVVVDSVGQQSSVYQMTVQVQ